MKLSVSGNGRGSHCRYFWVSWSTWSRLIYMCIYLCSFCLPTSRQWAIMGCAVGPSGKHFQSPCVWAPQSSVDSGGGGGPGGWFQTCMSWHSSQHTPAWSYLSSDWGLVEGILGSVRRLRSSSLLYHLLALWPWAYPPSPKVLICKKSEI